MLAPGLLLAFALQSPDTNYQLGLERLREGRTTEARDYLEKAAQASPTNAAVWKALGMAAASDRDLGLSAAAFGRACDLDEQDAEACYYQGRALSGSGRYSEASKPLEKAVARAAPGWRSRIHRALALNFLGLLQAADAEKHFRESIRSFNGESKTEEDPRVDYGSFLVREGRASEAIPLLEQAVRARPDSARAHAELGKALLYEGETEAAVATLEKGVALDPKAWAVRLLLGRGYLRLGRKDDAEREMREGQKGWSKQ